MRLFDEQSGRLQDVDVRPRMGMYVCGITPYDAAHLGHAFTYVQFDVLVRYLRHQGADVTHVQNVTDVDDDILRAAQERNVYYLDLAEREVALFEQDMSAIGVTPPTHSPRATQFVPAIVEEVSALIAAGHGYERDGWVYFRAASDPAYGQLSQLDRERMIELAAERGGHPDDPRKDDPLDFVLWQRSLEDEPRWDSPWGRGRPGWHIECSTMARRLLGQPVDIHGGGKDLVFPHHESEIAQAEGMPGPRPFVRHWAHTGEVGMAGTKMSKSLGNLVFVRDLLDRYDGATIRSFLLRHHYRDDWDFREEDIEAYATAQRTGPPATAGVPDPSRADGLEPWSRTAFYRALDDDLDTPRAMAILDGAAGSDDPEAQDMAAEGRALLGLDAAPVGEPLRPR